MMTFIIDIYMTLSEDTKNEDKEKAEEMLDEQNEQKEESSSGDLMAACRRLHRIKLPEES